MPASAVQQFSERLHAACTAAGIPERGRQTTLAKRLRISYQAVKKWLDGVGFPDMARAIAVANLLGVNVNWLLQGTGPIRGDSIPETTRLVLEVIDRLPIESRRRVLGYLRFELSQLQGWFAEPARSLYATAIDTLELGRGGALKAEPDDDAPPAPILPRH